MLPAGRLEARLASCHDVKGTGINIPKPLSKLILVAIVLVQCMLVTMLVVLPSSSRVGAVAPHKGRNGRMRCAGMATRSCPQAPTYPLAVQGTGCNAVHDSRMCVNPFHAVKLLLHIHDCV